jgi:nucleotide-binding universal stress UspA family protein
MKPPREILFPSDFSQATTRMAPYAKEMAQRFNAHVTVLHAFHLVPAWVAPPQLVRAGEMQGKSIPYTPEFRKCRQELQERNEEFSNDQFAGVRHTARIEDGDPAMVIEWVAQQQCSDIIILSTTGLGRFHRFLLGSITAKVLHDIRCPVLTSAHRPDPAFSPMNGYRSVLCAIEMNREANEILDSAAFLAQSYDARLCLVHMESISSRQGAEQDMANSRLLLEQALSRYSSAGLRPNLRILDASVPEGIRRTAIEERADLVVVGRGHQRDILSRLWSPLYTIILESPCPVLSV